MSAEATHKWMSKFVNQHTCIHKTRKRSFKTETSCVCVCVCIHLSITDKLWCDGMWALEFNWCDQNRQTEGTPLLCLCVLYAHVCDKGLIEWNRKERAGDFAQFSDHHFIFPRLQRFGELYKTLPTCLYFQWWTAAVRLVAVTFKRCTTWSKPFLCFQNIIWYQRSACCLKTCTGFTLHLLL